MTESRGPETMLDELELVQNPALGAFAIWQFALAYQARNAKQASMPLSFLVLPLVLHKQTRDWISSTRKDSGLAVFVAKLGEQRENLLAVHRRAVLLRPLTLSSMGAAVAAALLKIDYQTADLFAYSVYGREAAPPASERMRWLEPCSQKIGHWFAAVSDEQVARMLRVDY